MSEIWLQTTKHHQEVQESICEIWSSDWSPWMSDWSEIRLGTTRHHQELICKIWLKSLQ